MKTWAVSLALAIVVAAGCAPGPLGTSLPAGPIHTPRDMNTATLLRDGRVLIAGGEDGTGRYLASAEIYDPRANTFSLTGSMATPRFGHTATLLPNGRVLVAGGDSYEQPNGRSLASAEIYDPATGTFSPTSPMSTGRRYPTATALSDGRVLVAGGERYAGNGFDWLSSAEIFDQTTSSFSNTGSMTHRRVFHTATLLGDGRVLLVGGYAGSSSAELFDPATGSFSETGGLATGRRQHTATLLGDGRVLVAGGIEDLSTEAQLVLASAEIYDPKTGSFSSIGSMQTARDSQSAVRLHDGRVLIVGGMAELYDPKTGSFSAGPPTLGTGTATLLNDGRVLIVTSNGAALYQP